MERGELAADERRAAIFVFDGLLANCEHPRYERRALKQRDWEKALDAWVWNYRAVDFAYNLMSRYDTPVEVITWHAHGFARTLSDRLYDMGLPVRDVTGGDYERLSQTIAIDNNINTVFDPDPAHRWGYGWKVREFNG